MDKKAHTWIVEIRFRHRGRWGPWRPTVDASITREEGRKKLAMWRGRNAGTQVRLRKYRRAVRAVKGGRIQ